MDIQGFYKNMTPGTDGALRLICHLEPRRSEVVVIWDFKGEEGNSHGDKKQMFGKEMFARPSLTMGDREDLDQNSFARVLPVCHTQFMLNHMMVAPYLEQVPYLNSFRQLGGRLKGFF